MRNYRLSVILTTCSRSHGLFSSWLSHFPRHGTGGEQVRSAKALVERAVQAILAQEDPIGTEILVADDEYEDRISNHLESCFGEAVSSGRLRILRWNRSRDLGSLRNQSAQKAQGNYLTFLDPLEYWPENWLLDLTPHLRNHDLVVSVSANPAGETDDPIRQMIRRNSLRPSRIVIHAELFERIGGFPEGYRGKLLPKKIPGDIEYELVLKALFELHRTDRRGRWKTLLSPEEVLPTKERSNELKQASSLLRLLARAPKEYWGEISKRLGRGLSRRGPRI